MIINIIAPLTDSPLLPEKVEVPPKANYLISAHFGYCLEMQELCSLKIVDLAPVEIFIARERIKELRGLILEIQSCFTVA